MYILFDTYSSTNSQFIKFPTLTMLICFQYFKKVPPPKDWFVTIQGTLFTLLKQAAIFDIHNGSWLNLFNNDLFISIKQQQQHCAIAGSGFIVWLIDISNLIEKWCFQLFSVHVFWYTKLMSVNFQRDSKRIHAISSSNSRLPYDTPILSIFSPVYNWIFP